MAKSYSRQILCRVQVTLLIHNHPPRKTRPDRTAKLQWLAEYLAGPVDLSEALAAVFDKVSGSQAQLEFRILARPANALGIAQR
jgi:hypothetical protein